MPDVVHCTPAWKSECSGIAWERRGFWMFEFDKAPRNRTMWMVSEGFLESMQKAIFPLPSVRANHFMKSEICQAESCHERSAKAAILSEKNWVPTTESRVKLIQCEASLSGESLQDFCGVLSVQKVVEVGRCGGSTCKSLGACTKHIVHIHVAQQIWHMACTASFGHSVTIMAVLTKYLLQASSVGFKYCFKGPQSGTTQLFIGNQWFDLGFSGKIHWKPTFYNQSPLRGVIHRGAFHLLGAPKWRRSSRDGRSSPCRWCAAPTAETRRVGSARRRLRMWQVWGVWGSDGWVGWVGWCF